MALALFLIAGLTALDDYGVWVDGSYQRWLGGANLAHVAGEANALPTNHIKFYGAAFEGTLRLGESAFGLDDDRSIWLSRHLLTHLFYLAGGLFAYLLARRLFGNGIIALFAMLLFLLHPRLYAHSFFNSKDIPFFTMFIIALYLAHRAFTRDKISAFAMLGVGVGILLNLRIMGVILLTAIPALRALDLALAQGWEERKRVLITIGTFALASGLTIYALLPYLWADPLSRSVEWWATFSSHPSVFMERFRGTDYLTTNFPWDYVPVRFSISSPPFALLLGAIGAAFILARGTKAPRFALRNTRLRFGLLLIACLALPNLAVIVVDVNVYGGWRLFYFLWAPFSLLAAFGLQETLSAFGGREGLRKAALACAGAGLAATAISMALIHPNEQAFFNFFVDRVTPERLRGQYAIGYSVHTVRQGLEWFSEMADALGDGEPRITGIAEGFVRENAMILPSAARARISTNLGAEGFTLGTRFSEQWGIPTHRVKVYDNTILTMQMKPDLGEVYERVAAKEPGARSFFDVYFEDDAVIYVKEPCVETEAMLDGHFIIDFTPHRNSDLRADERDAGFERIGFGFPDHGAAFDGKCVAAVPAPHYSVAAIRTSQHARKSRALIWEEEFRTDSIYQDLYEQVREEAPIARSVFDIYAASGALVYVKEPCTASDIDHAFFLHVIPERLSDLPEDRRRYGFDNLRFGMLLRQGSIFDGKCIASVPLPEYAIAGVSTGQRTSADDAIWDAAFVFNPDEYHTAYESAVSREPQARATFDVYLADGAIVYVKEQCDQSDTEAGFFLDIVHERASDLPDERREYGYEETSFDFRLSGIAFDGKCVARARLPDYPVASARTGQRTRDGAVLWMTAFSVNPESYEAAYLAATRGRPSARSVFDIHLADDALVYVKESCDQSDTEARFFLHIVPERVNDLPDARREAGFDNLDFDFFLRGGYFDRKCAAKVPLPPYPIASVRTGQFVSGEGEVWSAEFAIGR